MEAPDRRPLAEQNLSPQVEVRRKQINAMVAKHRRGAYDSYHKLVKANKTDVGWQSLAAVHDDMATAGEVDWQVHTQPDDCTFPLPFVLNLSCRGENDRF
jgi:hypothetical protein